MAISTQARTELLTVVVAMFDAAPGVAVLSDLSAAYESGATVAQIAASLSASAEFKSIYPTFLSNSEFATQFVDNLIGGTVSAANRTFAIGELTAMLNAGKTRSEVVLSAVAALKAIPDSDTNWTNAKAQLNNKVDVANHHTVVSKRPTTNLSDLQEVLGGVDATATSVTTAKAKITADAVVGQTFSLTVGADTINGTTGNDTINGSQTTAVTWTVGDKIDGGAGDDTFNVTQTAAITTPTGATVKNVETVNLLSGTTGNNIDTTTWTGLNTLNVTGVTAQTVTAAGTTDVSVTGTTATGATTVNGGKSVTVTETGANGGTVTIGGNTAPTGSVKVDSTILATNGSTGNAITVTGGTDVTVTQKGANAANTTVTDGAVTVTGSSATKSVTVTADKAATASATVVGHVNGDVTVNDAARTSATTKGFIETVTLTNFANATVNSGALTTLNLSGTGTTVNAGTLGALTTPANTTLAVNANGLTTTGAVTIDSDITTLNLAGNTAATTVASLVANGATALNVSGDAKVTLTAQTLGALQTVTVTNTGGVSLGTALAAGVTFTGGAGDDTITLSNAFTKAITMGAGNDTVTYGGAAGTGGSVAAGDGTDRIIMTSAQAADADGSAVFNSKFTGFEILRLSDALAANTTLDLDGLNKVTTVELAAGGANATTSIIDNLASGGTVDIRAASTGVVVQIDAAVASLSDVLNLKLSNATAAAQAAGSVTAANVETINISTVDLGTGANAAATVDTVTLVATAAKSVTVSGNNGLNITNTGNTAITSFDASGVVANGTTDTAANLAVTFASANTSATATVTIKGGAGNDTLTGNASKDTIDGGAGNDIINGGTGQDTITVGNGRDVVEISNNAQAGTIGSGTANADIINGFTLVGSTITGADFSSTANFQSVTTGGANLSMLRLDVTNSAGGDQALTVEANGTGSGQAAGVTYTVSNGILTLSGSGAATVDTLGEWLTEVAAVAATDGDVLAFRFGSDTYVFAQNGTADVLVQLVGVTGTSLVEASAATSAAAGAIIFSE